MWKDSTGVRVTPRSLWSRGIVLRPRIHFVHPSRVPVLPMADGFHPWYEYDVVAMVQARLMGVIDEAPEGVCRWTCWYVSDSFVFSYFGGHTHRQAKQRGLHWKQSMGLPKCSVWKYVS